MITPISEADWIDFHFSFFIKKNYHLALIEKKNLVNP